MSLLNSVLPDLDNASAANEIFSAKVALLFVNLRVDLTLPPWFYF